LLFFYSSGCGHCLKVKNRLLPEIERKYKGLVEVEYLEIGKRENYELLLELEKRYNIKQKGTPTIFVEEFALVGEKEIKKNLEQVIQRVLTEKSGEEVFRIPKNFSKSKEVLSGDKKEKSDLIVEHFKSFSVFTVITAGLIDGINPCAFTVIVFFISFLTLRGYKKREVKWVGFSFLIAVFLTYLALGLGIFKFFQRLRIFYFLSQILYYATAGLAFLLSGLAIYDYREYKKTGNTAHLKLQLPFFIKSLTHQVIREGMKRKTEKVFKIAIVSFIIGFLISLLEAVCTGQVYLPTIVLVSKLPELRNRAFFYLVLYNLMFILPLLAIFLLAYKGFSSEQFARFASSHLGKVKLLMATLFLVLGIALLILH